MFKKFKEVSFTHPSRRNVLDGTCVLSLFTEEAFKVLWIGTQVCALNHLKVANIDIYSNNSDFKKAQYLKSARANYTMRLNSLIHPLFVRLDPKDEHRIKRETVSPSPVDLRTVHSVPLGVPFYLSCPISSYHAVYTWEHEGQSHPCLQMQSNCLHLISAMVQENYGNYECISKERDYTKVVKKYHLMEPKNPEPDLNEILVKWSDASVVVPQIWVSLGLALAVVEFEMGRL